MSKFISAKEGLKRSVIYTDEVGKQFEYFGGDPCWRTNNPGNLRPADVTKRNNQIGKALGFAVFPDYQTGHKALIDCLKNVYGNSTIPFTIKKFAPPKENNTKLYIKFVLKKVGVSQKIKVTELSDEQFQKLWKAIEKMEGGKVGTIKEISLKLKIIKVQKNRKGTIVAYYITELGWVSKADGIKLVKNGKIDAVIATSRSGNLFLRTRPDIIVENNFDKLG